MTFNIEYKGLCATSTAVQDTDNIISTHKALDLEVSCNGKQTESCPDYQLHYSLLSSLIV